jgi:hypothetical protein
VTARIYQPTKTAMQSGRAKTRGWVLEFDRRSRRTIDPLMGWTSSSDMLADQVRITFDSREDAVAYAERHGLAHEVVEPQARHIRPKSYAANFRWDRID